MKHYLLLWLKSNRGSDHKQLLVFDRKISKDDAKEVLQDWAEQMPAWNHGDNMIRYGWRWLKVKPRKDLLKDWDAICKSYARIRERKDILSTMMNPLEEHRWKHLNKASQR